MKRFVESIDRGQATFLPECLDDFIGEDNPVRAVDVFVGSLDLGALGFDRVLPEATGRPGYHPATLLKIYIYGYLNRVQSSRRLERECQRNIELIWLTGRLMPDFKTIADFRKDYGEAIRGTCRHFVELCRRANLLDGTSVAIDGSKFILAKPSSAWTQPMGGTRTLPGPRCSGVWARSINRWRDTCRNWKAEIAGRLLVELQCRKLRSRG